MNTKRMSFSYESKSCLIYVKYGYVLKQKSPMNKLNTRFSLKNIIVTLFTMSQQIETYIEQQAITLANKLNCVQRKKEIQRSLQSLNDHCPYDDFQSQVEWIQ
eukprot:143281_1